MQMKIKIGRCTIALCLGLAMLGITGVVAQGPSGHVFTTIKDGTEVNFNLYGDRADVYISGGPQNTNASGLPDGTYYFQVTDPSGKTLLSTDNAVCRQVVVVGQRLAGTAGPCPHALGTFNDDNGVTPVKLAPFAETPNPGAEYKVWIVPVGRATIGSDPKVLNFSNRDSKTDNFKVVEESTPPPPVGSCQPSSSLSAIASGNNVASYVPKGSWSSGTTGIQVVSIEGTPTLPTTNPIPTADAINSCASNSVTGVTVCTANNNKVYVISALSATPTVTVLTSSGTGGVTFSGGTCTNCGVAMDSVHNKAVIALALGAAGAGFQYLNLATNTFEPAFPSRASGNPKISEDALVDPLRNLLLNGTEANQYELINVATTTSPTFFERGVTISGGEIDSSGADCQTGIILGPSEFPVPSQVFIANLSSSSTVLTPGSPGTWTGPAQVQTLSESNLTFGANSVAVAQGTHLGILSGEFGGNEITAIRLPSAIDTGATVPAIQDWVSCSISGFAMGLDPHTLTAFQSPNAPNHAIALLASSGGTHVVAVDLTNMLDPAIVPRSGGGHHCASAPLPASVVTSKL